VGYKTELLVIALWREAKQDMKWLRARAAETLCIHQTCTAMQAREAAQSLQKAHRAPVRRNFGQKRNTMTAEEGVEAVRERKTFAEDLAKQQHHAKSVLRSLAHRRQETSPPALLVDGYNVVMAMHPYLDGFEGLQSDDVALLRSQLTDELAAYAWLTGTQVAVVWDAMGYKGVLNNYVDRIEDDDRGVTTVWAGGSDADTYIVRAVDMMYDERNAEYVVVASNDHEVAMFASDRGARIITADDLLEELGKEYEGSAKQAQLDEAQEQAQLRSMGMRSGRSLDVGTGTGAAAAALSAVIAGFHSTQDSDAAAELGMTASEFYARQHAREKRKCRLEERLRASGLYDVLYSDDSSAADDDGTAIQAESDVCNGAGEQAADESDDNSADELSAEDDAEADAVLRPDVEEPVLKSEEGAQEVHAQSLAGPAALPLARTWAWEQSLDDYVV
jgi:predicted RNA-binding protein with PIN domain